MNPKRPLFKRCPSCGSRKIKLVNGAHRTQVRGKRDAVPGIRRHERPACGEVLLDYEAVKKIERRRFAPRKTRRLARTA